MHRGWDVTYEGRKMPLLILLLFPYSSVLPLGFPQPRSISEQPRPLQYFALLSDAVLTRGAGSNSLNTNRAIDFSVSRSASPPDRCPFWWRSAPLQRAFPANEGRGFALLSTCLCPPESRSLQRPLVPSLPAGLGAAAGGASPRRGAACAHNPRLFGLR